MYKLINLINKYKYTFLIIAIILLASWLRLYHLSSNPLAANQDEALNGYDAYMISYTLHDHHGEFLPIFFESYGDWVSPLLTYITVPFVRILGLSIFSTRLPVALLNIASVYVIYILIKLIFDREDFALIGAFLLAIMPWNISLSRFAIPPDVVPFFFLLTLYFFINLIKVDIYNERSNEKLKKFIVWYKDKNFYLFILSASLLTYTYPTQKLFVPLLVFCLSVLFFRDKIYKLLISIGLYSLLVSPQFILTILNPQKYNSRFNNISIFSISKSFISLIQQFLIRYLGYIGPNFLFWTGDKDIQQHVPGMPADYLFLSVFFYVGVCFSLFYLYKYLTNRIKSNRFLHKVYAILSISFLLSPIAASLTINFNHTLRDIQELPLVIIFTLIGVYELYLIIYNSNRLKKSYIKMILTIVFSMFIVLGAYGLYKFNNIYWNKYPYISDMGFNPGLEKAIIFANTNKLGYTKINIDSRENIINQGYMYYLFYSKISPKSIESMGWLGLFPNRIGKNVTVLPTPNLSGAKLIFSYKLNNVVLARVYVMNNIMYIL